MRVSRVARIPTYVHPPEPGRAPVAGLALSRDVRVAIGVLPFLAFMALVSWAHGTKPSVKEAERRARVRHEQRQAAR